MSFILNSGRFGAAADPGLTLLQSATLWLDASDDIANAQWIRNKGTGGRALDAREGSVGSAQVVKGVLKLPGTASNNATAPDSAALDITGDIDIRAEVAPIDWTPTGTNNIVSKVTSATSGLAYGFGIVLTTGILQLYWTADGVSILGMNSTVAPTVADGERLWVRATMDVNDGSGNRVAKFYTSTDGSSWSQLGSTVTTAGTTSIQTTTTPLNIGSYGTAAADRFVGSVFRVTILNGYDGAGSVVFDADFTAVSDLATSFTESSSNAATVTINSTTGVDTNDPLLLTHTGTNYLYLPGATSNNATSPDSAALDITDDLEIIIRASSPDWTPSVSAGLVVKSDEASSRSFQFYVDTTGQFVCRLSTNGSTYGTTVTSSAPGLTDGTAYWIRMTRVRSSGAIDFYYAADQASVPTSWTALTGGTGSTSAIANSTASVFIGSFGNSANTLAGSVYRVILRSTIGGSNVFDADFTANTNQSSFTESSSNAATVTINRATSGRKAVMVTRPVWLFGTDDYMEIADNALLDFGAAESLTVVAVARTWDTVSDFALVDKRDGNSGTVAGWSLDLNALTNAKARLLILDGSTTSAAEAGTHAAGVAYLFGGQRDAGAADGVYASLGSTVSAKTTDTTTATLANTLSMTVGKHASGGAPRYFEGEIIAVAVFRSALTSTELGQIATYYGV